MWHWNQSCFASLFYTCIVTCHRDCNFGRFQCCLSGCGSGPTMRASFVKLEYAEFTVFTNETRLTKRSLLALAMRRNSQSLYLLITPHKCENLNSSAIVLNVLSMLCSCFRKDCTSSHKPRIRYRTCNTQVSLKFKLCRPLQSRLTVDCSLKSLAVSTRH